MLILRNNVFHRQCNDYLGIDSQNSFSISCVLFCQFSLFKTLHIISRLHWADGIFHIVLGIKCSTREKLSLLSTSKALKQFFFPEDTIEAHLAFSLNPFHSQQLLELKLANKFYTLLSIEFLSVNITRISLLRKVYSMTL